MNGGDQPAVAPSSLLESRPQKRNSFALNGGPPIPSFGSPGILKKDISVASPGSKNVRWSSDLVQELSIPGKNAATSAGTSSFQSNAASPSTSDLNSSLKGPSPRSITSDDTVVPTKRVKPPVQTSAKPQVMEQKKPTMQPQANSLSERITVQKFAAGVINGLREVKKKIMFRSMHSRLLFKANIKRDQALNNLKNRYLKLAKEYDNFKTIAHKRLQQSEGSNTQEWQNKLNEVQKKLEFSEQESRDLKSSVKELKEQLDELQKNESIMPMDACSQTDDYSFEGLQACPIDQSLDMTKVFDCTITRS